MKRQRAEEALHRFFEEWRSGEPAKSEIEPVLDRVWERLEWKAEEAVVERMPAVPASPARLGWAAAIVLVAVLVNVVVWRQGNFLPTGTGSANGADAKSARLQDGGGVTLTAVQEAFELASVKALSPSSDAAKTANQLGAMQLAFTGCSAGYIGRAQVGPGRLTIPAATVLTLVMIAYGKDCDLVEGGPAWARSGEYFEIQALLPPGIPTYTLTDLSKGNAPELQGMLQDLLASRFHLVLKRELREMPVYTLTVESPGKLKVSPEEELLPPDSFPSPGGLPAPPVGRGGMLRLLNPAAGVVQLFGHAVSVSSLAKDLTQHTGRIVVDQTGLDEVFDVQLNFIPEVAPPAVTAAAPPTPPAVPLVPPAVPPLPDTPAAPSPVPSLRTALAEELGLKLEAARLPIEVLVIESVERPSEN